VLRLASAAVLAPLLWVLIKLTPPIAFYLFGLSIIGLACLELYSMLEAGGQRPFRAAGLGLCLLIGWSFSPLPPALDPRTVLVAGVLCIVAAAMAVRREPATMLGAVWSTLLATLVVALMLGHLIAIRSLPGDDGADVLLALFLCVILADTGAYYVGSTLGRHRFVPSLSPRKTWEGVGGGVVGGLVGALIAHLWFYKRLPLEHALVLGVLLALTGLVGDLSVSMVKRAVGVKDSSQLIPGHGGVLDRTDSLLFAAPVTFYYYLAFLAPR
jgi:phosphatidate cytidylyltransferase